MGPIALKSYWFSSALNFQKFEDAALNSSEKQRIPDGAG